MRPAVDDPNRAHETTKPAVYFISRILKTDLCTTQSIGSAVINDYIYNFNDSARRCSVKTVNIVERPGGLRPKTVLRNSAVGYPITRKSIFIVVGILPFTFRLPKVPNHKRFNDAPIASSNPPILYGTVV